MSVASKNQTAFPLLLVSFYFLPSAPFATVIFRLAFIQIYAIKGGIRSKVLFFGYITLFLPNLTEVSFNQMDVVIGSMNVREVLDVF